MKLLIALLCISLLLACNQSQQEELAKDTTKTEEVSQLAKEIRETPEEAKAMLGEVPEERAAAEMEIMEDDAATQ